MRSVVSATRTCATNGGGEADRPAIDAPFLNAGSPVWSRYGTGHNHDRAPSAICPANWKAFSPSVETNIGSRAVLDNVARPPGVTTTLKNSPW